jgi:hypothetical protein
MGYGERQRRQQDVDPVPVSALPSLVGQLLWQGVREERQKWYGLLIFLPRFYLALRFNRRLRQLCAQMAAAKRAGGTEAEAAQQEFEREFMALLLEKKLVKPDTISDTLSEALSKTRPQ